MEPEPEESFEVPLPRLETGRYLPESVKYMKPSPGSVFYIIMGILVLLRRHKMISYPFDLYSLRNPQIFRWGGRLNKYNYKNTTLVQKMENKKNLKIRNKY